MMTRCKASFLSRLCFGVCVVLSPCVVEAILKDACPHEAAIILSPEEPTDNTWPISMKTLNLEFDEFPRNLTWFANGSIYGCICDVFSCLRLCCPRGSFHKNATCIPTDGRLPDQWPEIYFKNLTLKPNKDFFPIVGYPCREIGGYILDPWGAEGSEDEFHLLDDGLSIHTVIDDSVTDRYCLQPQFNTYVPILCFSTDIDSHVQPKPVQIAGIVFSIPFLLATFIVYVLLPELNTIYGFTLRCYVASLGVGLIFLVTDRLASLKHFIWLCRFIALGIHFPIIASFTWLNVMCIDLWHAFGEQKRGRFLINSIYAWGIASYFSGAIIFVELVPGLPEDWIRPDIASSDRCWFASRKAEVAYFYGPITVIVICNIFTFVATAMKMMWHQRTIALDSNQSKHHGDAKKWFILGMKLVILTSIKWIADVISWWWQGENSKYFWYITETMNASQGITIFLIFVQKRKILLSLKKRYNKIRRSRKDNEFPLDYSSRNASRSTSDDTSDYETTESHCATTSKSIGTRRQFSQMLIIEEDRQLVTFSRH